MLAECQARGRPARLNNKKRKEKKKKTSPLPRGAPYHYMEKSVEIILQMGVG